MHPLLPAPPDQAQPFSAAELDILDVGAPHDPRTTPAHHPAGTHRRIAGGLILTMALAGALVATHNSGRVNPSATQPAGQASPPTTHRPEALASAPLLAPTVARPGAPIYLIGTRRSGMCGTEELRFDGRHAGHRELAIVTGANNTTQLIVMTMAVPATARPGRHEITLYGPLPATHGPICGDRPEHQGRIANQYIRIIDPVVEDAARPPEPAR
jgi:hypothetical protein